MKSNNIKKKFLQHALAVMISGKPLSIEFKWNSETKQYDVTHHWLGSINGQWVSQSTDQDFTDLVLMAFINAYKKYLPCLMYESKRDIIKATWEVMSNIQKYTEDKFFIYNKKV